MDDRTLFELILAANYLDISQLLEVWLQTSANIIKGKSVNEIRARCITKAEEEQVRKENECCKESEYFCKKYSSIYN